MVNMENLLDVLTFQNVDTLRNKNLSKKGKDMYVLLILELLIITFIDIHTNQDIVAVKKML